MIKGQVISGEFEKIVAREKSDASLEIGELLVSESKDRKILLQVHNLLFSSQISQANLELIAGMKLEDNTDLKFFEGKLRNYTLALLKPILTFNDNSASLSKSMPRVFSQLREPTQEDFRMLAKPKNSLHLGKLRSGSKILDVDIHLDGLKVFTHHILIPGTTGRGKSTLMSNIIWESTSKDYVGMLVLDPHNEYYGTDSKGLKDHPNSSSVVYYTLKNPPPGARTLKINLKSLMPSHFQGVVDFSDPQKQALNMYYKRYKSRWIEAILLEKALDVPFRDDTLGVVRRRLIYLLDIEIQNRQVFCRGLFDLAAGEATLDEICLDLESAKSVVIDTSAIPGEAELLVGSLIASALLRRYKHYKLQGVIKQKPAVSIVLEEAPRVLGKEVLERGPNIFSTIAREGRKFKVGLTAITQLPSLIPRQILANINTKIILGIEMQPERQAIIDSASQDLSSDSRNIASLDIGEAIVTSNFSKFAIPVRIPKFDPVVTKKKPDQKDFSGVKFE